MEITEKNIKMWSIIGPRATVGLAALDLAKNIKNLMVLTCDVSTSAGLDRYRKTFPEKYLDLGIAEQNMIGVAAGLASENFKVITTTFAPFQTMRCCEQIKVNLGYMKQKVCMIGIASGLVLGNLGYTHCCIEDIGILRSIPNLTIISPADSLETVKAIESALNHNQSVYIRITGSANNPMVYKKDYSFEIGKSLTMKEGEDVVIFSSGSMVSESIEASTQLEKENIKCKVVNVHTIKPINSKEIINHIKNKKLILTVEEHNIIGGLGSAISEIISSIEIKAKLVRLGINDQYDKGGSYNYLKDKNGLNFKKIVYDILKNLNVK
jgi:transketolase|tara:strand:- start:6314 stop:7285 length:972 start_codon:yes stop_codon:yes gene_type:complete